VSGAELRSYLLSYSKFTNAYSFYYPNRDFALISSFLKAGPTHILKELDEDITSYLTTEWHNESCIAFIVYIVEEYFVNFISPKINLITNSVESHIYLDEDVLEWLERFVIYHYYVEGWSLAKIEKACLDSKTLRKNYIRQAVSKLRKAFQN
jgi:hypothetical protein